MLLTWYLISISLTLLSPVHFLCPNHTIALIPCIHTFLTEISLLYSIYLFLFNLSFYILLTRFSFQIFRLYFDFYLLNFLTHTVRHNKTKKIKNKNKTTILVGGKWQSSLFYFLLIFFGAIPGPLFFILALLPITPWILLQTPFPFDHSPNPF